MASIHFAKIGPEGPEGSGGYLEQTLDKQARVVLEGGVGPAQARALPLGGREEEAECSDNLRKQEVEIKSACSENFSLTFDQLPTDTSAGSCYSEI